MPRASYHSLSFPHFEVDHNQSIKLLYAMRILRDVINKLSFFFLPVFLFQIGQDLPWWASLPLDDFQKGILTICGYFVFFRLCMLLFIWPAVRLLVRQGYASTLALSQIGYALVFILLTQVTQYPTLLFLVAFVDCWQTGLFWSSDYSLLSTQTLKKHLGEDLGLLQFLIQLAAVLSPAVGGAIIVQFGFSTLFLVALVMTLFSLILALFVKAHLPETEFKWSEFIEFSQQQKLAPFTLAVVGRYLNDAVILLWPLYVFGLLGQVDRVGFLYTFSLFLSLLVSLMGGFYLDHTRSRKPFWLSGGGLSLVWLLRTQVITIWGIALVDMLDKMVSNFHWLFYDVFFFRHSGKQALFLFTYKELVMSITAIFCWLLLATFFVIFPWGWSGLFILAAVGVLSTIFIQKAWSS